MPELKNNQVEISLRYAGSDPEKAFKLARNALTFKGFKFDNMDSPVEYTMEASGEYTTKIVGTNSFLPEQPPQQGQQQPTSSMNNAPPQIAE